LKTSNETLVSNLELSGNFSEVLSSIKQGQQYLTSLEIEDIILWLDAICTSWSDRQSDVQQLYSNQGINFLIYWFRKKHLLEITDLALRGNRKFLDGFHTVNGSEIKLSAQPRGVVSHWIAGNVPMLGMLSLIQGIITKNANLVKVSKDNLYVVPTLLASMAEVDVRKSNGQLIEGKKIVNSIACIYYPSSDKSALNEMSLNSQVRVAWGGMEAVENIINLPRKFGCEDIVFGPKTSFMVIGSEKLSNLEDSKKIAKKASIDASQFEQQGCNAPHTVFVEKGGEISPLEFSKLLSSEMELASKRIVRDPGVVPDVGKILTLRAKYEMMGEAFYSKGLEWTVLFSEDDKGLAEPCYFRTLFVRPIDDVMLVENYCSHLTQTAGVALSDERKEQFALRVTAKGIDRVPDIGAMSAYEVPWDGIFMIDRLVRWCKIS
tara:strand:+ start:1798 stop:3099 length:1302 start_codon:yes stop_codon:yes gene_type:complete